MMTDLFHMIGIVPFDRKRQQAPPSLLSRRATRELMEHLDRRGTQSDTHPHPPHGARTLRRQQQDDVVEERRLRLLRGNTTALKHRNIFELQATRHPAYE